jgi:1,4-dihydroxy-2-naphthoyl-CoA hydrolase
MASIFKRPFDTESLNNFHQKTASKHLGIEYLEIGEDYIKARLPVDERTKQPFGLLHGGISCFLAEELGSLASVCMIGADENKVPIGVEINANHVRGVKSGWLYGKVTPIHLGRTTHIWNISMTDEKDNLVCISRLTIMVVEKK